MRNSVDTVITMIRVRHRRRLRSFRFLAVAAPTAAIALTGAAAELQGRWWWAAAAAGAGLSLLLGLAILRLDRRWRVLFATDRAARSAAFAVEYERHAEDHKSFVAHMVELLDNASDRIGVQRMTLNMLEAQIAELRSAQHAATDQVAKGPGHVVDLLGDVPDWTELWPNMSDAPTVVDLVAWEERSQPVRDSEPGEIVERSA
jgi:hypothetical protein